MPEEGSTENLASAIYGTILSTALIAAYSEDAGSKASEIAGAVFATSLVFWVAHAYAGILARGAAPGRSLARVGIELERQWPLVVGSVPPILPLLLGPLGALSDDNAETVAIATGVVLLTGWGAAIAWRRGSGPTGVAMSAAASAFFGLVVVGLKALVH
jgi:hypothetical protein